MTWWEAHRPSKRRLIQLYSALLYNAHLRGFIDGEIYQGQTKAVCDEKVSATSQEPDGKLQQESPFAALRKQARTGDLCQHLANLFRN